MIRDLIKWVVPGLATVLAGTSLTLAMTSTDMAEDLTTRAQAAMTQSGQDWAELTLDGRDLKLTGTTTSAANVETAIARLDATPGIGTVVTDTTLAPMAKPYLFTAEVNGQGPSISGGVPDSRTRDMLAAKIHDAPSALDLRSGMPERTAFIAGASFAIDNLKYFDQGGITLSDTTLNLSGRAASEKAFRDLQIVMRAGAPTGLTLGEVKITPALVEPYSWSATFDGKTIAVTGIVPDDVSADRYRTADVSGIPVATGLTLGSGEPQDFAERSMLLLTQLARLEHGSATILGDESSLTGSPPSVEVAQTVTDSLQGANSIVTLDAPRIADYWMSATLQPGSAIIFDGYAPDEATRKALGAHANADISYLKLGRGAPERYQSAVDYGLAALDRMSEGRFSLRDNVMTLTGTAASLTDYQTIRATLSDGAPQGLVLAMSDIKSPLTTDYGWSASKSGGAVTLSGRVPSPEIETAFLAEAGPNATTNMVYASGEPANFIASAEQALELLSLLDDGEVYYAQGAWTLTGTPASPAARSEVETRFADGQLAAAGWSMALAAPVTTADSTPEPTPATPSADSEISGTPAVAVARTPIFVPQPEAVPEPEPSAAPAVVAQAPTPAEAPAIEPAPSQPEPAPAPSEPAQPAVVLRPAIATPEPADISACAAPIAQFSARNAIFFASGAARIAAESDVALDELAVDLAACPNATVHIEGHTDTDGDAGQNMALSVSRAEAVVNALIQRGVAANRLYAVGYGETMPIADNATPEGKRMNRRIVVTVKAGE